VRQFQTLAYGPEADIQTPLLNTSWRWSRTAA